MMGGEPGTTLGYVRDLNDFYPAFHYEKKKLEIPNVTFFVPKLESKIFLITSKGILLRSFRLEPPNTHVKMRLHPRVGEKRVASGKEKVRSALKDCRAMLDTEFKNGTTETFRVFTNRSSVNGACTI
jgi:hypothetical protein